MHFSESNAQFFQPLAPREHWHIDIAYLNVAGTFYYLCSVLEGASRAIIHWEIREAMTEVDVECILQRAREQVPDARPRITSDNGPQFIAKGFKVFIRIAGMTHVRISPCYPQSNGKIERWHKTLKSDAIRVTPPSSRAEARLVIARFIAHYNGVRLHSALGYVTPNDVLAGRTESIWAERDAKLEAARDARQAHHAAAREAAWPAPAHVELGRGPRGTSPRATASTAQARTCSEASPLTSAALAGTSAATTLSVTLNQRRRVHGGPVHFVGVCAWRLRGEGFINAHRSSTAGIFSCLPRIVTGSQFKRPRAHERG